MESSSAFIFFKARNMLEDAWKEVLSPKNKDKKPFKDVRLNYQQIHQSIHAVHKVGKAAEEK